MTLTPDHRSAGYAADDLANRPTVVLPGQRGRGGLRRPPGRHAPLVVVALANTTWAAVISLLPVLVTIVAVTRIGSGSPGVVPTLRFGFAAWLLAHGVPLSLGGTPLSLVPLAITGLAFWRVAIAGRNTIRAAGSPPVLVAVVIGARIRAARSGRGRHGERPLGIRTGRARRVHAGRVRSGGGPGRGVRGRWAGPSLVAPRSQDHKSGGTHRSDRGPVPAGRRRDRDRNRDRRRWRHRGADGAQLPRRFHRAGRHHRDLPGLRAEHHRLGLVLPGRSELHAGRGTAAAGLRRPATPPDQRAGAATAADAGAGRIPGRRDGGTPPGRRAGRSYAWPAPDCWPDRWPRSGWRWPDMPRPVRSDPRCWHTPATSDGSSRSCAASVSRSVRSWAC